MTAEERYREKKMKEWEEEAKRRGIEFKEITKEKSMKYTDNWFLFPVRIYDGFSVTKAIMVEDKKFQDNPNDAEPEIPDWVEGYARVPLSEIISWVDYYSEGRPTEEVAKKGFDLTMIETKTLGKFESTWKREKFEKELNNFYEISKKVPIL